MEIERKIFLKKSGFEKEKFELINCTYNQGFTIFVEGKKDCNILIKSFKQIGFKLIKEL